MNVNHSMGRIVAPGFLSGGGEMGQLTRALDWKKNPLGSPDDWPQSLRTTLSSLLNTKFPMFLFWGPELICFYNDAFRPSLGIDGKHPAVGKAGKEVWSEIWTFIGPLIGQVLSEGLPVWFEDQLVPFYRNGRIEDIYWTFSYSPVQDESGRNAGVLVTCTETTEKVKNLARLKESTDELAFAIEAAQLGTWDLNPITGRFTANDRLKDWFGLAREEEIDLRLAVEAIIPGDRERVSAAIRRALEYSSGGRYDIEYTIVSKLTGIKRVVRARGTAGFNDKNEAVRLNGTLQDINDHVMARQVLKESEQRFQAAVTAVEGIVWTNNAEGMMEGVQAAWSRLTGQGYEEYQGFGWSSAVHPEDAQPTIDAWNEAVKECKTFVFEHRVRMRHGQWGRFSVRAVPILDADGKIQEWVGVHTDITEQKEAERALIESEERFRTLAETLPQLVWMTGADGQQLYASSRWQQYSGIEPVGPASWQQVIHPDDMGQIMQEWRNSLEKNIVYRAEARLRKANGEYRWHSVQGEPIRNEKGAIIKWIGAFTDIHDQKESEHQLEALVAERTSDLARSNEDLEQFAHVASHDLKEPVRKIRLFVNRLQEEMADVLPERAQGYLDRIQRAAERMLNMIEGVLAYSSNDRSKSPVEKIDLQAVLGDIRTDLDMVFNQKKAQLHYGDFPRFEGVTVLIYQLFYNLINNSLKFLRTDVQPEIHLSGETVQLDGRAYVRIRLQDNGIGFKQEDAQKIFESFARLHPKDKYEGTGLGLALCRKIVIRHHGMIAASGELEQGALFEVTLPVTQIKKTL